MRAAIRIAFSTALLGLSAAPVLASDGPVYASEQAQINAILLCKETLGIGKPVNVSTSNTRDGRVLLTAMNGNGVTIREARRINGCKHASLETYPGQFDYAVPNVAYEVNGQPIDANPIPSSAANQYQTGARQGAHVWSVPECPNSGTRLHRGTLYCVDGQVLQ